MLLPIFSLPSPYGIGTLGRAAFDFIDFLREAGQSLWQILPVNPTSFGDSPYQSFSAFAGNPYFIDLEILSQSGLLTQQEININWGEDATKVDYGLLFNRRFDVLAFAAERQNKEDPAFLAFCAENAFWLNDYALFMTLKEINGGGHFNLWPSSLRAREEKALAAARKSYAGRIEFWRCVQFFFFTQWRALKAYANAHGVGIVGDIPIYVAGDSADLWANPHLFEITQENELKAVAGVPPDSFSADGQLWGNPLYNWPQHASDGYAWWLARLRQAGELFDITRIDHFRGLQDYYAVPAGAETARNGTWQNGPGIGFINAVHAVLPQLNIIAEDLGFLTDEVRVLLKESGYPGMKILQFAFVDSHPESEYLPHNYPRHTVVYTGTHDNATSAAWINDLADADAAFARRYLGITKEQSFAEACVRAAIASVADTAIIPLADWMGLGAKARINTPSTIGPQNWSWRLLPNHLSAKLAADMRLKTVTYGRVSTW